MASVACLLPHHNTGSSSFPGYWLASTEQGACAWVENTVGNSFDQQINEQWCIWNALKMLCTWESYHVFPKLYSVVFTHKTSHSILQWFLKQRMEEAGHFLIFSVAQLVKYNTDTEVNCFPEFCGGSSSKWIKPKVEGMGSLQLQRVGHDLDLWLAHKVGGKGSPAGLNPSPGGVWSYFQVDGVRIKFTAQWYWKTTCQTIHSNRKSCESKNFLVQRPGLQ